MPWWGWIAVGAILLVAELTVVDLEFYLVFLGISALAVGLLDLAGLHLAFWLQWLVFAIFALASLVVFRHRVYVRLRPPPNGEIPRGVDGDVAIARDEIAPDQTGRVTVRGASWNAINRGTRPVAPGTRCRVLRSEGVTLEIRIEE